MAKVIKASKSSSTPKYIFVVGGVMSGVGKGVTTSSIALLLAARGLNVTAIKIDPYINVDAGTMNPTEHGETFVLKDGLETDQDMGNYERFLNKDLPAINYMTTGSVYLSVIQKERNLEYKGKNVEVVPDIPLEVISRIKKAQKAAVADVVLVEIGGTVGEYQNVLFLEAVRMMKTEHPADVAVVMVSYLPVPGSIGEMKTKPTQTAVRTLNSTGVFADIIVARSPLSVDQKRKAKIATFCNVRAENIRSGRFEYL
jgi:CTP synthase